MIQPTENTIHRSILHWLQLVMPDAVVHHSANEGVRSGKAGVIDGARKKSMGQVAGFPDLQVLPFSNIGPLFFEVKTKTGKASKVQLALFEKFEALGYKVRIVRSIDDTRQALADWGVATKERAAVKLPVRGVVK